MERAGDDGFTDELLLELLEVESEGDEVLDDELLELLELELEDDELLDDELLELLELELEDDERLPLAKAVLLMSSCPLELLLGS